MLDFEYLIATEIEAIQPMQDLVAGLQEAFDESADGQFQVLRTSTPGFMVLFLRSTAEEDADYLLKRMSPAVDARQAALLQLADELGASDSAAAQAVVDNLRSGRAKCVEFWCSPLDDVQKTFILKG